MKGIYSEKDICPVCKKRYITYDTMEITSDKTVVCNKECKEEYEERLIDDFDKFIEIMDNQECNDVGYEKYKIKHKKDSIEICVNDYIFVFNKETKRFQYFANCKQ